VSVFKCCQKIALTLSLLQIVVHGAGAPAVQGEGLQVGYDGPVVSNCGLNATLAALTDFGLPIDSSALLAELGLDVRLTRSCSLLQIKNALERSGVESLGLQVVSPAQIYDAVKATGSAIVHIRKPDGIYHYAYLKARDGDSVMLVDYPHAKYLDKVEFLSFVGEFATGAILLLGDLSSFDPNAVKPSKDESNEHHDDQSDVKPRTPEKITQQPERQSGAMIKLPRHLLIGDFRFSEDAVIGDLVIKNSGSATLKVSAIKGSCSCFEAPGDNWEIGAQCEVRLQLKFNREKLNLTPESGIVTTVIVVSDDPALPVARVDITSTKGDRPSRVVVAPGSIRILDRQSAEPYVVNVFLPIDSAGLSDAHLIFNEKIIQATISAGSEVRMFDRQYTHYELRISVKRVPPVFIDEIITISPSPGQPYSSQVRIHNF
jgi:hypothetical protein